MASKTHRFNVMLRLGQVLGATAVLWLASFSWFVATLPDPGPPEGGIRFDGIVVLTGGPGRVQAGLDALASGNGKRLLISGVNAELANETILNAIASDRAAQDCCIDLGRQARDTYGNATEASDWAAEHDFHSLLIITADYHLPRALIEFGREMQDVELVAQAVDAHAPILSVASEFNKYLFSAAHGRVGPEEAKD